VLSSPVCMINSYRVGGGAWLDGGFGTSTSCGLANGLSVMDKKVGDHGLCIDGCVMSIVGAHKLERAVWYRT
jgi:hypothetical protein